MKTIHESKERLDKLKWLYIRETYRFKRQIKLSPTQKEIQHRENSAFTPVRPQGECSSRVLFKQGTYSQKPIQEIPKLELETINNQPVSKGLEGHQGQENLPQRIGNQDEINAQIASQL